MKRPLRTSDEIKRRRELADSLYCAIIDDLDYSLLEIILDDYTHKLDIDEVQEWETIITEASMEDEEEPIYQVK